MDKQMIDQETVVKIAKLSRLSLAGEDVPRFRDQMSHILEYVNKLNELNTENVAPTSHALSGLKDVFREDEVRPSLPQDDAIKNAPKRIGGFFAVPKIIE